MVKQLGIPKVEINSSYAHGAGNGNLNILSSEESKRDPKKPPYASERAQTLIQRRQDYYRRLDHIRAASLTYKVDLLPP
jgi:hypothetical protein